MVFILTEAGKMSDYYISFIPSEPNYVPSSEITKQIESIAIDDRDCSQRSFEVNHIILFADAGENVESISCPFCKADLLEWWGEAMSSAYSGDDGFINLIAQTPCCNQSCSLNDLIYYFPQGFYKTKLTIEPTLQHQLDTEDICQKLKKISGVQWRTIHTHI